MVAADVLLRKAETTFARLLGRHQLVSDDSTFYLKTYRGE